MRKILKSWMKLVKQALALMIGVPDYPAYVKHHQTHHPDEHMMSYEEFFIERQRSRYSSKKPGRCC